MKQMTLVAPHYCISQMTNLHLPAEFNNAVFQTPPHSAGVVMGWGMSCLAISPQQHMESCCNYEAASPMNPIHEAGL